VQTASSPGVAYLDASALVKLVLDEDESVALRAAVAEWPRRASSRLAVVEVLRVVRRRDRRAEQLARSVLARISLLRLGDRELVAAASLDPPTLRILDAVHVATALRLESSLTAFVSYDARQLEAATAAGLAVVSPS
jgi:predicted nucleic acid-binding protein